MSKVSSKIICNFHSPLSSIVWTTAIDCVQDMHISVEAPRFPYSLQVQVLFSFTDRLRMSILFALYGSSAGPTGDQSVCIAIATGLHLEPLTHRAGLRARHRARIRNRSFYFVSSCLLVRAPLQAAAASVPDFERFQNLASRAS